MLRQLRSAEKMKRILWFGLLILIIPSMVAFYGFGTGNLGTGLRGNSEAARITYPDGTESVIGPTELRFAKNYLQNRLARYGQDQGIMLDQLTMQELTGSRSMVDQAVNLDILRHYAESHGLTVTTEEVMQMFHQNTTQEQRQALLQQLQMQGQSVEQMLEEERKGRVLQRASEAIGEEARVTYYEAWQEYESQNESLVADYVRFTPTDYMSSVSVTEAGLKEYFNTNQEDFRIPDQVIYDYVLVRKDDLKSSITVTDDEVTSYYGAHKEDFRLPRKAEVSQIFLKVPTPDELQTTSPAELTSITLAVTKKADDLYGRAAKGEDFASLADSFSEEENFPPRADAGTTASDSLTTSGGNLGLLSEEVAQTWYGDQWTSAVFSMEPGSITRPIRTSQGFAIVQVKKVLEGDLQPVSEVRPVIENKIKDEKVEPVFVEVGTQMEDVLDNVSGGLDALAAATSSTIKTTPKTNEGERFIGGIGLLGDFQEPIADLDQGIRSDLLSDSQRHLVVQVKEEIPSHIPTLEEAKARVEQAYKLKLAEDKAREKAEELLTKSTDFAAFQQAVLDSGTTTTHSRPFTRPEVASIFGGPVQNFAQETANLEKGTMHMSQAGRPGQQQSFIIWHATQVTEPSKTDFSTDLDQITARLAERKREIMVLDYIRDQREKLEGNIEIDPNYL